jgi:GNAT superfamily N-acetyltransferase
MSVGIAPPATLGEINEMACDDSGVFGPLVCVLAEDERIHAYGLRDASGGPFVCVALTLTVGDDVGILYVATEAPHRRKGLASKLVRAL